VAQPNASHAGRRGKESAPGQLIRYANPTVSRLVGGHFHNGLFDMRFDPILQTWFAPADLFERQLAALVVQLLEAIETVARVTHHFAGLGNTAEQVGQVQQTHFVLYDLLIGVH
jgi:hypothetical protein